MTTMIIPSKEEILRCRLMGNILKVSNRAVAGKFAKNNGVGPLTTDHWKVIDFVRQYYQETGIGPRAYEIYPATGFRLQRLFALFPGAIRSNARCVARKADGHYFLGVTK